MASRPDGDALMVRPPSFSSDIALKRISPRATQRQYAVRRPSHSNVISIFPIQWVSLRDTRDVAQEEWQVLLGEAANVRKAAYAAAPVGRRGPALRLFRQGLSLIGIGFLLAALTLAFETAVLPIAAGAALFVGCVLAADAVERYSCAG